MYRKELDDTQRKILLQYQILLNKKRYSKINGGIVTGGNKQRDYISEEEARSPTEATESVLLIWIIDAKEESNVAGIDIPNAFIQTRIDNEKDMAIIKTHGVFVDIILDIAPGVYEPYITTYSKVIKQLITQYMDFVNGTMVASLIFYCRFCEEVKIKQTRD